MRLLLLGAVALGAWAAPPMITDLQPRGAQKGRAFTLTLVGRELTDVIRIHSTMPASFTAMSPEKQPGAMGMEGRYASFLVEPKGEVATGIYPIRVETADGISNLQLFSVGDFPETTEEESTMGARPGSNDSIEAAQSLPASAITVTGTLRGAERDFYRIQGKAGERRVIELEGRRIGSAIDPVLRIFDQTGKQLAKSEDTATLGLDARVDVKFPREGYYYIEVHDARFSAQTANFYRLKTGSYEYPTEVFPLGGRRGESVDVSLGAVTTKVDLAKAEANKKLTFVNMPNSPALPLPFEVGEFPEVREPAAAPLGLPVSINGKLAKAGEVDHYTLQVTPGQKILLEMRARELGTSKLMGVIEVKDEAGKRLARAGDEPLPEDFYTVGGTKTANDPYLFFEVPEGVRTVKVSVEDLALRGGTHYAYRLHARTTTEDFSLNVNTPYVNIPAGGSVLVPVSIERKGYMGAVNIRVKNPPAGLIVEAGHIPAQNASGVYGNRGFVRNGVLILSAKQGVRLEAGMLEIEGVGTLPDGKELVRRGAGLGMSVAVNGATIQGSVDRQRPVNGLWMGLDLPVAGTGALPVSLSVALEKTISKEAGEELYFRWKWEGGGVEFPPTVGIDLVGSQDTRAIEMRRDPKDPNSGTFLVTTTRLTQPGPYDFYVTGRVMLNGQPVDVYSRPIVVTVKEAPANANAASEAR